METVAQQYFTPLSQETRTAIPTADTAFHLSRKSQTLRAWACLENGPIRPIRINGRLAWPVAEIRKLLCQSASKFDHPSASNFDQGKGVNFTLISCAV